MAQVHPPGSRLAGALQAAGMADVPERFSVALPHQQIPARILAGIDQLIRVFDRVTLRPAWQDAVTRRHRRSAGRRAPRSGTT
jgi:hypothetical protein